MNGKIGFDNQKYIELQSENIEKRIGRFSKLYVEFGGKLFDDYHASRVLPGFEPDSKIKMLLSLKDRVEMMIVINADDIEKNKIRGDLGITYSQDMFRLIDAFREVGLYVGSVVITRYMKQPAAQKLRKQLEKNGIKVAYHYPINNYPNDIDLILSKDGFGKNEYIETTKELVVITAPGPGSGKMATCLSQMYHDYTHNIKAGYAKFETFPIWNIPLNHPVNLAYEAATADLNDVNMIDPFHLEAYNEIAVNYNRDVEAFPVLSNLLRKITGKTIYKSPTDMGVNMVGFCISNDKVCQDAAKKEIVRRYYKELTALRKDESNEETVAKLEMIMSKAGIDKNYRKVVEEAEKVHKKTGEPAVAVELQNGKMITGKTSKLMGASSACLLNALKEIAGIPDINLLSQNIIEPVQKLKTDYLKGHNPRLHTDEVLIALAIESTTSDVCRMALDALPLLENCEGHSTVILSEVDRKTFAKLGIRLTESPVYQSKRLYHK
ncbi:MAG: DUF1846 domain-containing protein [Erysipelotrichaceae bacterium]|nr:DUF1846 domain-containing protein [Erysipelotrichaceae bacterium]